MYNSCRECDLEKLRTLTGLLFCCGLAGIEPLNTLISGKVNLGYKGKSDFVPSIRCRLSVICIDFHYGNKKIFISGLLKYFVSIRIRVGNRI